MVVVVDWEAARAARALWEARAAVVRPEEREAVEERAAAAIRDSARYAAPLPLPCAKSPQSTTCAPPPARSLLRGCRSAGTSRRTAVLVATEAAEAARATAAAATAVEWRVVAGRISCRSRCSRCRRRTRPRRWSGTGISRLGARRLCTRRLGLARSVRRVRESRRSRSRAGWPLGASRRARGRRNRRCRCSFPGLRAGQAAAGWVVSWVVSWVMGWVRTCTSPRR